MQRDMIESVRKIQESGIEVTGGFIIGFDSDPPEIFDLQIDFVQDLAVPTAMIGLLMALPNTKLYERLEREGRITSAASGNNTHNSALNFVPKMDRETLEDGYYRVLQTVYEPRRYFDRCLEVLNRYPKAVSKRQVRQRIHLKDIRALFASLLRQSFSRYGHIYLSYLARALRRRPDLAVSIVTMAVQGYHYFTITGRVLRARRRAVAASRRRVSTRINAGEGIDRLLPKPSAAN